MLLYFCRDILVSMAAQPAATPQSPAAMHQPDGQQH